MRAYRILRRRQGLTLVEAMIAMGILLLMIGACGSLYIAALNMYQQGTSLTMAHERGALACQLMSNDIREAINVDYPGPHAIIVTMPAKDVNGHNIINPATKTLVPGYQEAFYYANDSGFPMANGTTLWRALRPAGSNTWERIEQLAPGVSALDFTYAPSIEFLELVKLDLTIRAKEGHEIYEQSLSEEVFLRNH